MFDIVAHRGAPEHTPENTLPAFLHAIELGADAVELDVRLTADRVPVVYHYFYLEKLTNLSGPIFRYTWNDICQASLALPRNGANSATAISSLEEVLDKLEGRIGFEVDIKGPEPQAANIIADVLTNFSTVLEKLEVACYEPSLLREFQHRMPGVPADLQMPLSESWMKSDVLAYTAIQRGQMANARAIHLHADQLSDQSVELIRQNGFEVHAWGINDWTSLEIAQTLGIERICTDNLRLAIEYRNGLRE